MQATPASDKVKVWPATVRDPLSAVPALFGLTLKETDPLPLPLAPPVMVAHAELLEADQPQPAGAVTLTDPGPPAAVNDPEPDNVYVQGTPVSVME